MGLDAWFTVAVVSAAVGLLSFTRLAADLVFMAGLTLLLSFNVLSPAEALSGFANEGVATVGILYVVVAGLKETGGVGWLSQRLLRKPTSLPDAQFKLMLPVAFLSAFLNNTPIVAMLIPAVDDWAKKFDLSVSKLMIPLSYAAILGGTCTLVGTSTNLVLNGLLRARDPALGLGMFELAWVGLPTAILGMAFIMLSSRWLLPNRKSAASQLRDPREYSVEMLVEENGPLVGKTIEGAGLRHLKNLYLVEVERNGSLIPAVSPYEVLRAKDRLVFVGITQSVVELQRIRGLLPASEQVFKLDTPRQHRVLIEAVVSNTSPLTGRSVRAGGFRNRYGAVIIAVARNGVRLKQKIGDIVLRPGDTLLLEASNSFPEQHRNSRDFFLVSALEDSSPLRFDRIFLAIGVLLLMVLAVATGLLTMFKASLIAAGLMLLLRCISASSARRSVDWSVLIVIAAAFGFGRALELTGAAETLALTLTAGGGSSPFITLFIIYMVTALFSSLITNNAAAVLMFPIAAAAAASLEVSIMPFVIAIAMAASASFATPISYQTNLMVYGPGGYRFSDFARIGLPLNMVTALIALIIIPLVWRF